MAIVGSLNLIGSSGRQVDEKNVQDIGGGGAIGDNSETSCWQVLSASAVSHLCKSVGNAFLSFRLCTWARCIFVCPLVTATSFMISCSDAYKRISDYIFFMAVCILIYVNETISKGAWQHWTAQWTLHAGHCWQPGKLANWPTGCVLNNIIGIRVVWVTFARRLTLRSCVAFTFHILLLFLLLFLQLLASLLRCIAFN